MVFGAIQYDEETPQGGHVAYATVHGDEACGQKHFTVLPRKKNDHLYFLKKEVVKIVHYLDDGQEDIKTIIGPGSLFGELALIDGESPEYHAVALEDCVVCFVDVPSMQRMME